jgi:TPR repeat protein
MYRNGRGVPQSDAQSIERFRMAADEGFAPAQINLGVLYERGRLRRAVEAQRIAGTERRSVYERVLIVPEVRWSRYSCAQPRLSAYRR